MPISTSADIETATSAYDFVVRDADGKEFNLAQRRGYPTLFFNSASSCGFSKFGFETANKLMKNYRVSGFLCMSFPSSSFGQEPMTSTEAKKHQCSTHEAEFPIMEKVNVNGDEASPLWKYLQKEKTGFMFTAFIKWNYTSFLCDRKGKVVARFSPGMNYDDIEKALKKVLASEPVDAPPSRQTSIDGFKKRQEEGGDVTASKNGNASPTTTTCAQTPSSTATSSTLASANTTHDQDDSNGSITTGNNSSNNSNRSNNDLISIHQELQQEQQQQQSSTVVAKQVTAGETDDL